MTNLLFEEIGNLGVFRVSLLVSLSIMACGGDDDPIGPAESDPPVTLSPGALCASNPGTAIATFEDGNLDAAIRAALGIGAQDDLTCGLVSSMTTLEAPASGIASLVGIQNLTSLTALDLEGNSVTDISALSGLTALEALGLISNSITDISALSGLTGLAGLGLNSNSITDISALSGLTSLVVLFLSDNSITDIGALTGLTRLIILDLNVNANLSVIQPLLDNTGLGAGDTVNLSDVDPAMLCTDVALLQAKGVTVTFNVCT